MTGTIHNMPPIAGDDHLRLPLIQIDQLTKAYGKQLVLDKVCLKVERGKLVGLVGENGAGKSTLMRCLVGLEAYRGEVRVNGRLGYCPQEPVLADLLTPREQLVLFAAGYRMTTLKAAERIDVIADQLGFAHVLDRRIDRLSGGTRQKINLAGALLHEPDVLVLDEPYQGFDYDTYERFWVLATDLCARGCTVVVVTHLINDIGRLDMLFHLKDACLTPTAHPRNGSPGTYGIPQPVMSESEERQ